MQNRGDGIWNIFVVLEIMLCYLNAAVGIAKINELRVNPVSQIEVSVFFINISHSPNGTVRSFLHGATT